MLVTWSCQSFRYTCAVVLSGIDPSLVLPGRQQDVLDLVKVTRDIIKERVKGETWVLWVIAQRKNLPLKIEASVS
jgi:hypothetical protein